MPKIHFIVNPQRPSIGLRWPYEEQKIENLTKDFRVHLTRGRMHSEILVRTAIEDGCELIVSVGGDSTLSEIANGLYRASLGGGKVPLLAIHPELHAGDTMRSLPLRKSFQEFLLAYLRSEAVIDSMDLGEVEFSGDYGQKVRRVFVNCAGFGFTAQIVDILSRDFRYSRTKWNFLRMIARMVPFYKHPTLTIRADGREIFHQVPMLTGLIHNGRYAAHGLDLSPDSSAFDGRFELTLIRKTFGYRYLLGIFPLFAGLLSRSSFVKRMSAQEIQIDHHHPIRKVRVDFDGDCWGFLPAKIKILEKALKIAR